MVGSQNGEERASHEALRQEDSLASWHTENMFISQRPHFWCL